MSINKKLFIISISFILSIAIATAIVIFTSDYKNNDITINNAYLLEETLLTDLSLDERSYLLTPKFVIEKKLDNIGYVDAYSIERVFPNLLTITVELDEVIWCDDFFVVYDTDVVKKDKLNEEYCLNKPTVFNLPLKENNIVKSSSDYANVDKVIRELVEEVYFLDDETITFIMSDGITVYMTLSDEKTITRQLNNYFEYKVTNNTIDLRQKYC
ncbi:hypothetical protein RJG79_06690 [Mycoplasmatota bacterium WC44]